MENFDNISDCLTNYNSNFQLQQTFQIPSIDSSVLQNISMKASSSNSQIKEDIDQILFSFNQKIMKKLQSIQISETLLYINYLHTQLFKLYDENLDSYMACAIAIQLSIYHANVLQTFKTKMLPSNIKERLLKYEYKQRFERAEKKISQLELKMIDQKEKLSEINKKLLRHQQYHTNLHLQCLQLINNQTKDTKFKQFINKKQRVKKQLQNYLNKKISMQEIINFNINMREKGDYAQSLVAIDTQNSWMV